MAIEHAFAPGTVLLLFVLVIPGLGYLLSDAQKKVIPYIALVGLILSTLITLNLFGVPILENIGITGFEGPYSESYFGDMLRVDAYSLLFSLIFQIVAILVVTASISYVKGEPNEPEYYTLLLLATLGMMIVAAAGDLILLFVGLEIASLSTYVLAGFRKGSKKSTEAAMKYFIIGAFSSALAMFGISYLYGISGTTNIYALRGALLNIGDFNSTAIVGWIMLIAGFGFKIAAVPFHMWAPDVYEGAPTTISAFLAAGSKKMGFAVLFKVFLIGLIFLKGDWNLVFGLLAIITMTVGNLLAISQTSMKRMLAYSSIAQAGYIMIAICVGAHDNAAIARYAVAGGILHILTHAFMKTGAFIVVAIMERSTGSDSIDNYVGLNKRSPVTAFCMTIFLLSLAGIPPLAGFFSKFVLFSTAINGGGWFVALAVAGILNSALSLYYYARVIKYMYVLPDEPSKANLSKLKEPRSLFYVMIIAMVAVFVIGLYPEPFINACVRAGEALFLV